MVNPIRLGDEEDDLLPRLAFDEADPSNLHVRITPRFEWTSAPADEDPTLGLLVTLSPEGPPLWENRAAPAAHVVLALDVSASMSTPDKYPVLRQALGGMLAKLRETDADVLLSVVAFAYGTKELMRAVPASELTEESLLAALDDCGILFGEYTDLGGAIGRAGHIAYSTHRMDKAIPSRIYVLTDGKPQDEPLAQQMMDRLARLPIDIDALAFGEDADVEMLKRLFCGVRGGTVKHVRPETLHQAWTRVAEVVTNVVAKRSLVSVELGPGVMGGGAYRFRPGRHSYGNRAFHRGIQFDTDLGTLEAGRDYSLFFELRLPQTDAPETEVARITLQVPGWGGPQTFETTLVIPRHTGAMLLKPDPVVQQARHILSAEDDGDPKAMLRALRARREIYEAERRDPFLIQVIDKAVADLESTGTIQSLSRSERKALVAHTATVGLFPAA